MSFLTEWNRMIGFYRIFIDFEEIPNQVLGQLLANRFEREGRVRAMDKWDLTDGFYRVLLSVYYAIRSPKGATRYLVFFNSPSKCFIPWSKKATRKLGTKR